MCAECYTSSKELNQLPAVMVEEAKAVMETIMHPGVPVEPRPGLTVVELAQPSGDRVREEVAKWGSFPLQEQKTTSD